MLAAGEWQSKSLKQELQRHQKALVAANEREAALQSQIAEKEVALQAAEARENHKSVSAHVSVESLRVQSTEPCHGHALTCVLGAMDRGRSCRGSFERVVV